MHGASLRKLGPHFEMVDARVAPAWTLPCAGDLDAATLQRPLGPRRPEGATRRVFEVRSSDMIDEGIRSGDRLLIEARDPVPDGATALVDLNGRFMVKRYYRESDGNVRLEPANRSLLPLVLRSDRVRCHGVLIGMIRRRGFGAARTLVQKAAIERGAPERRRETADLTFRMLEQNLGEWTRITSMRRRRGANEAGSLRIRELGRSLRALVATYSTLSNPRLRRALLDEAAKISREMRRIAGASGWPTSRIRPLFSDRRR
jgi:hypothetical protein